MPVGGDKRSVRRFIRECGYKPTASNVERIQREVNRTQSQHERVQKEAIERGMGGTRDERGRNPGEVARRIVLNNIAKRDGDGRVEQRRR